MCILTKKTKMCIWLLTLKTNSVKNVIIVIIIIIIIIIVHAEYCTFGYEYEWFNFTPGFCLIFFCLKLFNLLYITQNHKKSQQKRYM